VIALELLLGGLQATGMEHRSARADGSRANGATDVALSICGRRRSAILINQRSEAREEGRGKEAVTVRQTGVCFCA